MATALALFSWVASSTVAKETAVCVLHDLSCNAPALVLFCSTFTE